MTLRQKLRAFARYTKDDGLANTSILAAYKLFPRLFRLLNRNLSSRALPDVAYDYHFLNNVQDFQQWSHYGGSSVPEKNRSKKPTYIWFVPDWENVWGGGHYTLFRFANHFAEQNTSNIIFIYNNQRHESPDFLQRQLDLALPNCKIEVIVDPAKLPSGAAAIATTWQSAYQVRAFPFAGQKIYFMQDYESYFYAFGTASVQANATYEFGFHGVTGGGWLKSCYERHGGHAINYRFAADRSIFYPSNDGKVRDDVKRVFFYGRPSTERRCFELGIASLARIHSQFPDVEIVIAGLSLNAPPPFKATLLGNMKLADTGDLYRTCDLGIAFSGTNLSYLPVELMASGVPTISNNGEQVEWHCKHLHNSYLVDPTPHSIVEAFAQLAHNKTLRQQIADGGLETMRDISWETEMQKVYEHIRQLCEV